MKHIICILIFLTSLTFKSFSQTNSFNPAFNIHDEELVYSVSWTIFRLGTIIIKTEKILDSNNPNERKITMIVESNPYIPFVDIEEYNETIVNIVDGMSRRYFGKHTKEGEEVEIACIYDDKKNYAYYTIENVETTKLEVSDTLLNISKYVDGPSLFNYTRMVADSGKIYHVPTMIDGKIYNTILNFCGPIEYIEIDAVDIPIRTLLYEGIADWEGGGSAGLSGDFTGWISDDSAAIPVRAEMEVFLGSVVVELEEWSRPGWIPPVQSLVANK